MFVAAPARLVASRWAPWLLLAISLVGRVAVTMLGPHPYNMIDLKVYLEGADHLTDGTLYTFVSGTSQLPFTYPPFSALLFLPLSWLPWTVARVLWQLASLACLPAIIYFAFRLLGRAGAASMRPLPHLRGTLAVGTALAYWLEPVATTFNYGQINLFLAVLVLGGAVAAKDWLAGAGVGLAAGIKLIPAVTGLYYLLQRRFAALVWSVVFFAATIAIMLAIIPAETRRYFTKLILDASRTGPVFSAINQSWRGALYRLAGQDLTSLWLPACGVTVVLGVWAAWAAARRGDRLGSLLAVEFVGLQVSPISWSHHWVWMIPLLVWGLIGPSASETPVRVMVIAWLMAGYTYVVPILYSIQTKPPTIARPAWQSVLGAVYPVLGLLTLVVLALAGRRATRVAPAQARVSA